MLREFNPPPGIFPDETTFAAEGRWAAARNIRFVNGKPQVIGGWALFKELASASCVTLFTYVPESGVATRVVYGMDSGDKLYVAATNGAPANIGVASFPNTVAVWSLTTWGNLLLASPGGGTLYSWAVGAGTVSEITQAPDVISCMLTTDQRQVLAFGCNEVTSGTFNGRCIRGCDLEDYTDWTPTSANNSFEDILDTSADIVWAAKVGPYIAVWTAASLHIGQFLGDPGQTYRWDLVASGCGLVGPKAVIVHNGIARWMSPTGGLYTWSPGGTPEVLELPLFLIDDIASDDLPKTMLAINRRYNELWVHYCTDGAPPDAVGILSLKDGSWSKAQIARSAVLASGVTDEMLALLEYDPGAYLAALGEQVFVQESGVQTSPDNLLDWEIESADWYLDNSQRRAMIRSFIPDFENQTGNVSLTVFVRDRPRSTAVTKGPYTITVASTKKDFRASGKIVSIKLAGGPGGATYFRLGKPLFDIVPLGER